MAGVVIGRAESDGHGGTVIVPDECPYMNKWVSDPPHCYRIYPDGVRRACLYWYGLAEVNQATSRIDVTTFDKRMGEQAIKTTRCMSLCMIQRRNRPAGV